MNKEVVLIDINGLTGRDFACNGSDSPNPMGGSAPVVGLFIGYELRDTENGTRLEDRTLTPLRGCIHSREGGICAIGENHCPVAGVVSVQELRAKQTQLKQLPQKLQ